MSPVLAMIAISIILALIYGANGIEGSIGANMTTANTPNAKKLSTW